MPDHEHEFNTSYWRVTASTGDRIQFLDRFYDLLMARSEEVARFFMGTDFKRQNRMLVLSLTHLAAFDPHQGPDQILTDLATAHRELKIPGRLFTLWLDNLLETVRAFDPQPARSYTRPGVAI
ncbi:MAG: truncated hemoglobin YjbI [Chlamydiales bacterium]|jgi:truncated hemoglobin YjbI